MINLLAFSVWASSDPPIAKTGVEFNWLLTVGVVFIIVAVMSIFVVPKFLDNALGIMSIVGVFFLSGMLLLASSYVDLSSLSKADTAGEELPQKIKIVDVKSNEFTVEWDTFHPLLGAIKYGITKDKLDFLEVEGDPTVKHTHHKVRVTNLHKKNYFVKIISGGEEFPKDDFIEVRLVR